MRLYINAHCRDCCGIQVYSDDGDELVDYDGYVPDFTGLGGGDDFHFGIDLNTGMIVGWDKIKDRLIADVTNFVESEGEGR